MNLHAKLVQFLDSFDMEYLRELLQFGKWDGNAHALFAKQVPTDDELRSQLIACLSIASRILQANESLLAKDRGV